MSFNIKFKLNDNTEINVSGLDSMILAELIYNFGQMVGLKEEHKASFTFNSQPLKADSIKKLSDLGIISDSVINVKTEIPLDYKPQNTGNSQTPQNNSTNSGTNTNNSQNMNMNAGNMNMNQNMNYGNMNMMNQNMNYGNMNMMNQNMNCGNMFMNPNMNYANMNMMNQNMNCGNMFMNPNMNYANMNMMNQNMNFGNMFMNPNMNYGAMNMNPNMTNFMNSGNNQNISNSGNVGNNSNIGQSSNNQNNINSVPQGDPNCLNLIFNSQGNKIAVQAQKDSRFCEIATKFANKAGVLNKEMTFIIFSERVKKDCTKTLEELKLKNNNTIEVIYDAEVIGA